MKFTLGSPEKDEVVFNGLMVFDNLFQSQLTIFQIITLENWTIVLNNVRFPLNRKLTEGDYPLIPVIFCLSLVLLGGFFLMNLILAVIMRAFTDIDKKEEL